MKKLIVKILGSALVLTSACALAACGDNVDLKTGATVSLTVETEATDVTIASTYGTVTGEGNAYTVTLDIKKDFTVTASAKGYKTVNLNVSVADIADGSHEATIVLNELLKKNVAITVEGITDDVAITCDGVTFTAKSGTYQADLSEESLAKGITATAVGAAPYTFTFTDEEMKGSYLQKEIFLIGENERLLEIMGYALEGVLLDAELNFIPYSTITTLTPNYGERVVGARVVLDEAYSGSLTFFRSMNEVLARVEVSADMTQYDNVVEVETGNSDWYSNEIYISDLIDDGTGYDPNQRIDGTLWIETETELRKAYVQTNWNGESQHYYISARSDENVNAIWLFSGEKGSEEKKKIDYNGQTSIALADFASATLDISFVLYDQVFKEISTEYESVTFPHNSEVEYPVVNGVIESLPGYSMWDNVELSHGVYAYSRFEEIVKVGDAWCYLLEFSADAKYSFTLKDKNGNPVTGATINVGSEESPEYPFTEEGNGVYSLTASSTNHYYAKITVGGSEGYYSIPIDPTDSMWTRDGRNLSTEITLRSENVAGLLLDFGRFQGRFWGTISVSIVDDTTGATIKKVPNGSFRYYLRADIDATVTFKVVFRYYDYTTDGKDANEQITRETLVTFNVAEYARIAGVSEVQPPNVESDPFYNW
ncbi:MAG: hypothetical protein J6C93_06015 [Clostridia bacterium]|nr:hypothetical protein [Clostridia bacterium]